MRHGINESLIPGRCHTAAALDDKIIFFGGGASNSCDISVFNIPPLEDMLDSIQFGMESSVEYLSTPEIVSHRSGIQNNGDQNADRKLIIPCKRCSSTSVFVGRYMVMFGGWSNTRRELGDLWVLDVAPGVEVCKRTANPSFPNNLAVQSILDLEFNEVEYLENCKEQKAKLGSSVFENEEMLHRIMTIMVENVSVM